MISVAHTDLFISLVALLCAYFFSTTVGGMFQALVSRWAGDDTAAEEGYLGGNPLVYADFVGMLCLICFGLGWGRVFPFSPSHVEQPHRSLKVLLVYLSQTITSLVLALVGLTLTTFLIGPAALCFALRHALFHNVFNSVSTHQLATIAHGAPSALLVVAIMLIMLVSLNVFFATWSLIQNSCYYLLYLGAEHGYDYMKYAELLLMLGPIVLFIFFYHHIRMIFLHILAAATYGIAHAWGVL